MSQDSVTDLAAFRQRSLGDVSDLASVQFDSLLDGLPDVVVYRLRIDADGKRSLIWVSASIEKVIGISRDDAMTDFGVWMSSIDPEDLPRLVAAEQAAIASGDRFRLDLRTTIDGSRRVFQISAQPHAVEAGSVVWDGTVIDMTARTEERAARERLARMVEASSDFATIATADMQRVYINPAGLRMLGLPEGTDPARLGIFEFQPPEEVARMREVGLPAATELGVWTGETAVRDVHGVDRPVSMVLLAHRNASGDVTHYSGMMRDLSERVTLERALRRASAQAETALREVNHRVKNLFAIVPAIVNLSARTAADVGSLANGIRDRIAALSRSHTMTLDAFTQDEGMSLHALVRAVLEPYEDRAEGLEIEGPTARLPAHVGNTLSLTLHELATNAVKYGALSAAAGRVRIEWAVEAADAGPRELAFTWTETGGPRIDAPPVAKGAGGFGTRLVDRLAQAQAGTVTRDWRPEGLRIVLRLPLAATA